MGLKDLFKKEDPKSTAAAPAPAPAPVPAAEEKKQVADIRQSSQSLMASLEKIHITDPTGRIPKEKLDQYAELLKALKLKLVQNHTYGLDTRNIDKIMVYMAEHFEIAVKKGSEETATRCIKGLAFGVNTGHEAIVSSDMDRADEIMEKRMDTLNKYKTIIRFSEHIDENNESIRRQTMDKDAIKEKFIVKQQELTEEITANPHLVDKIKTFGGKLNEEIDPDAFALQVKQQEFNKLYDQIANLKKQISLKEATIVNCRSLIASQENLLSEIQNTVDQDLVDEVVKNEKEFRDHLVDIQNQMRELDELSDKFTYALEEIYASPLMVDYVIKTDNKFEAIQKKIQEDEEGRKLGLERMAQLEQEAQQEQRLLNN